MKLFIAIVLCCVSAAQASLKWESRDQTLKVHPTQVFADAAYRFTNAGNKPVTISHVKVMCGCLSHKLSQYTYEPGESGEIIIRFDLRNRTAKQNKGTKVATNDGMEVVLHTKTDIPRAYNIAPIMMKWLKGNTAKTKTARLTNPNQTPIRLHSPTSSHKDLPVELKTVREGYEYEVVITRRPEAVNARAVVRIRTEPPPGHRESKTLKLYVHAQ